MLDERLRAIGLFGVGLLALVGLAWQLTWSDASPASANARQSRRSAASSSSGGRATVSVAAPYAAAADGGVADAGFASCFDVLAIYLDGRPVPDAVVLASDEWIGHPDAVRDDLFRQELRTDSRGAVRVCAPPDTPVALDVWDDNGGWGHAVQWDYEPTSTVRVLVAPPFRLAGRVMDETGRGLPRARIAVGTSWAGASAPASHLRHDETYRYVAEHEPRTDAEGRFDLQVAVPGFVDVHAELDGFVPVTVGPVRARPGEATELELVLRDGAALHGTVEAEGEPVVDARVELMADAQHVSLTTDERGRFSFSSLDPDELYSVRVSSAEHAPARFDDLWVGEHTFPLRTGARLEVEVRRPALLDACPSTGHDGVEERLIHVSSRHRGEGRETRYAQVDPGERATLDHLPAGEHQVMADSYGLSASTAATLREGQTTRVTLELSLDSPSGMVVVHAPTLSLEETYPTFFAERADGTGVIRTVGGTVCQLLDAGRYALRVEQDDAVIWESSVDITAGRVVEREADLRSETGSRVPAPLPPCPPLLDWSMVNGAMIAEAAVPGAGILPGDRLLSVEDDATTAAHSLTGPPSDGDAVSVELERPGGERYRAVLYRFRCE